MPSESNFDVTKKIEIQLELFFFFSTADISLNCLTDASLEKFNDTFVCGGKIKDFSRC